MLEELLLMDKNLHDPRGVVAFTDDFGEECTKLVSP